MNNRSKAAVIDIGSNSIRYMEAELKDGLVFSKGHRLITVRLATNLNSAEVLSGKAAGRLAPDRMDAAIEAIGEFAETAKKSGLPVFAYATSAVRDAANRDEFLRLVKAETGVEIDVLSGEREAEYAFTAVNSDGLIDIGGGSTQIITAESGVSFPLGCVRCKDMFSSITDLNELRKTVSGRLSPMLAETFTAKSLVIESSAKWCGVGGTITTLGGLAAGITEYSHGIVDGVELTLDTLPKLIHSLHDMGDEKRREHPLLKKRHDIILYGALILETEMRFLGINKITVSEKDGMDGYFMYRVN